MRALLPCLALTAAFAAEPIWALMLEDDLNGPELGQSHRRFQKHL